MKTDLQIAIDFFVARPNYLEKSTGKFISGVYGGKIFRNKNREFVQKAKDSAREVLHKAELDKLKVTLAEKEDLLSRKFTTKGECEITGPVADRIRTLDELITYCKIDTKVWEIVSWECNKWEVGRKNKSHNLTWDKGTMHGTSSDKGDVYIEPLFQVKVKLTKLQGNKVFQQDFKSFLNDYVPKITIINPVHVAFPTGDKSILVLPKQDAHFDRYDVKGNNDIAYRFALIETMTSDIVREAAMFNKIEKVTYVVGSDQFNSEWTGLTTGGTPQHNLLPYKKAFKAICDHEITVIENLLGNADVVELLFVPGNHDEFAGWHMIQWLKCFYRNKPNIIVNDSSDDNHRRYERYSNTAIMYDHGASLNGKELAQRFPIEFKKEWSKCDNYYIFSGDKHHELSLDVQGIKYYRVPALTPTKSNWEHKKGYITKGEMQAFLIKENRGLTNIYSRLLE